MICCSAKQYSDSMVKITQQMLNARFLVLQQQVYDLTLNSGDTTQSLRKFELKQNLACWDFNIAPGFLSFTASKGLRQACIHTWPNDVRSRSQSSHTTTVTPYIKYHEEQRLLLDQSEYTYCLEVVRSKYAVTSWRGLSPVKKQSMAWKGMFWNSLGTSRILVGTSKR